MNKNVAIHLIRFWFLCPNFQESLKFCLGCEFQEILNCFTKYLQLSKSYQSWNARFRNILTPKTNLIQICYRWFTSNSFRFQKILRLIDFTKKIHLRVLFYQTFQKFQQFKKNVTITKNNNSKSFDSSSLLKNL